MFFFITDIEHIKKKVAFFGNSCYYMEFLTFGVTAETQSNLGVEFCVSLFPRRPGEAVFLPTLSHCLACPASLQASQAQSATPINASAPSLPQIDHVQLPD